MPAQIDEESIQNEILNQLNAQLEMTNIAEGLDREILEKIGAKVVEDYNIDKESRSDWERDNRDALDLAKLIAKEKTWGGAKVANVKYPILATAAIQFSARAYPNLVKGNEVVKVKVIGEDDDGIKADKAERVRQHMAYQILDQMESWEDGMDQLLACLPILGVFFKKTYFKPTEGYAQSDIVFPNDLIVNYHAKSLEPLATHYLEFTPNEVAERVRSGQWLDVEFGHPQDVEDDNTGNDKKDDREEDRKPHICLEQHRWWDLDEDGYEEPYVVTVHRDTEQVVRITARYSMDGIQSNNRGEIVRIEPIQHFTRYPFFPAFDGSFYCMGFGILLSGLNSTVNTTINQLLDASFQSLFFLSSQFRPYDSRWRYLFFEVQTRRVENGGNSG
jgi:chaperonin GroES